MFFDWTYLIFVMPAVIFAMWASAKVNSTYRKYQNQGNARGITGAQAARTVLDQNGLSHVKIERTQGELTDHYDPANNVIRLSDGVYSSTSTAAIGIACHEVGHAIQYAEHYAPAKIRSAIVPVTNIGSRLAFPLILLGIILGSLYESLWVLIYVGIGCFALSTVFQLVTLPTEFNASRRAVEAIEANGMLYDSEMEGTKKVLTAAALTYVAALAVSLMQLLRLVYLFNRRD
jgi:Zn-dependent membrane protease YugP